MIFWLVVGIWLVLGEPWLSYPIHTNCIHLTWQVFVRVSAMSYIVLLQRSNYLIRFFNLLHDHCPFLRWIWPHTCVVRWNLNRTWMGWLCVMCTVYCGAKCYIQEHCPNISLLFLRFTRPFYLDSLFGLRELFQESFCHRQLSSI